MKKHALTLFLCLLLLVSPLIPTAAATMQDEGIQLHYTRIWGIDVGLNISLSGRADCYSQVVLDDTSDTAELTMELQRSNGGNSWRTIKTWSTSGSDTVTLDKDWYVTAGYTYRVYATVNVYTASGNLAETESEDSLKVTY